MSWFKISSKSDKNAQKKTTMKERNGWSVLKMLIQIIKAINFLIVCNNKWLPREKQRNPNIE